ncbi:MAG TPA: hypothetical protein VKB51_19545 [bacterium]|nr:hypothetical protein [bacterium]
MTQPTDTPTTPGTRGPLLDLLQRLARTALAAGASAGPVQIVGVESEPDGAILLVRLRGAGGLLDTTLRLRLTIQSVGADVTRCALSMPRQGGLGRLLGAGLQRLPRPILEQVLGRIGGDAASLDGDTLVLDHKALVRRLKK